MLIVEIMLRIEFSAFLLKVESAKNKDRAEGLLFRLVAANRRLNCINARTV
jgi:hypothetical protein